MNTLIIGASGKIGKYFREVRKKDYYYTYNKSFFSNGIYFNILKQSSNIIKITCY